MDNSSFDARAETGGTVPLGPAVSPRRPGVSAGLALLAEPLPPFVRPGWRASVPAPATTPEPEVEVEAEPIAAEPEWVAAEPDEPRDDLGLVRGAAWGLSESTDDLLVEVTDELWEEPGEAAPPAEPVPVEPEPWGAAVLPEPAVEPLESAPEGALEEWSLAAAAPEGGEAPAPAEAREAALPVQAEPQAAPAPRVETALAEAMSLEEGPALQEVAGRLERIALALREGRPVELFSSGASDPLEVLIAGYALGYSEAFRRVGEERRKGQ